jgi:hypothetical protein
MKYQEWMPKTKKRVCQQRKEGRTSGMPGIWERSLETGVEREPMILLYGKGLVQTRSVSYLVDAFSGEWILFFYPPLSFGK